MKEQDLWERLATIRRELEKYEYAAGRECRVLLDHTGHALINACRRMMTQVQRQLQKQLEKALGGDPKENG